MKCFRSFFYFIVILLISISLSISNVFAADNDIVNIPDTKLKNQILYSLGLQANSEVTELKMKDLRSLSLSDVDIENITGLEYAINLEYLNMNKNKISDFTIISNLSKLTALNLDTSSLNNNNFPNLNNLKLVSLGLSYADITSAVYDNFINIDTLKTLNIQNNNKITTIEQLKLLPNLESLFIQFAGVNDFTCINDFPALKNLYAHGQNTGRYDPVQTVYKNDVTYNETNQTLFIPFSLMTNRLTNFDNYQPAFTTSTSPAHTYFTINDIQLEQSRLNIDSSGITVLAMDKDEYSKIDTFLYNAFYNNPSGSYQTHPDLTTYITSSGTYYQKFKLVETLVTKYKVTYYNNGATSGSVPIDNHEYVLNDIVNVKSVGNLNKPGHGFIGWNTNKDGTGTMYQINQTFSITNNMTLYAIWRTSADSMLYSITYYGNNNTSGTAPIDKLNYTYNSKATIKDSGSLLKDNYKFKEWNTKKDGSGTSYKKYITTNIKNNLILYAQWQKDTKKILPGSGSNDMILICITIISLAMLSIHFKKRKLYY